jgi:hypothetical protein
LNSSPGATASHESGAARVETTKRNGRHYWHVVIEAESLELVRRSGEDRIPLKKYLLKKPKTPT